MKTLLERQDYATLGGSRDGAGAPRPYDVAGWTLLAQMGIDVHTIDRTFSPPPMTWLSGLRYAREDLGDAKPNYYVIDARETAAPSGQSPARRWREAVLDVGRADGQRPDVRVGIGRCRTFQKVRPTVERIAADLGMRVEGVRGKPPAGTMALGIWRRCTDQLQDADEGWTRWLLGALIPIIASTMAIFAAAICVSGYDAIILPSTPSGQLLAGSRPDLVPPQYAGGLGELGVAALKAFVEAGGTLICLNQGPPSPSISSSFHCAMSSAKPASDFFSRIDFEN